MSARAHAHAARLGAPASQVRGGVLVAVALVVGLLLMHGFGLHGSPTAHAAGDHGACTIMPALGSADDGGTLAPSEPSGAHGAADSFSRSAGSPGFTDTGSPSAAGGTAVLLVACIAVLVALTLLRPFAAVLRAVLPRHPGRARPRRVRTDRRLAPPAPPHLFEVLCVSRT